jgi:hypothetical protein
MLPSSRTMGTSTISTRLGRFKGFQPVRELAQVGRDAVDLLDEAGPGFGPRRIEVGKAGVVVVMMPPEYLDGRCRAGALVIAAGDGAQQARQIADADILLVRAGKARHQAGFAHLPVALAKRLPRFRGRPEDFLAAPFAETSPRLASFFSA